MRARAAGRLVALLAAALAAGCATAPKAAAPVPPKKDEAAAREAALRDAVRLMEAGTAASLSQAAVLLAGSASGAPRSAAVQAFGGKLFALLYPDVDSPFPKPAAGGAQQEAPPSDFFVLLQPALVLLQPGPKPSDDAADDMLDALTRADSLRPDSVLPPYLRALLLERQGRPAGAVRPVYEECLRRDAAFYPAKIAIVRISASQGTAEAELPLLAKYASELPSPSLTYQALAEADLAAGKPHQAADAAARALLTAPDSLDLVVLRARAFLAMGDWYQALSLLDSLLRLKPDTREALALKAGILFEKAGDPDGAMQVAADAESRFPGDPAFPELRGRILMSRGNGELADAELKRALQLDPSRVRVLVLLAQSAAHAERWQEAASYIDRIPAGARDAGVLVLGWRISMSLGDTDRAMTFVRALRTKEGGDEPTLLAVRTLLAAGKVPEALDVVAKGLAAMTSPTSRSTLYVLRAQAQKQGGDTGSAFSDLRQALRENPDDVEALVAIADLLGGSREYRRAINYLRHAEELSPDDAGIRARVKELTRQSEAGN